MRIRYPYKRVGKRGEGRFKRVSWDSKISLTYALILGLIGGGLITLLGSVGGYLSTGHTVLEAVLRFLGLPL
jgi:anaerobic selenocysteine-containing dehydrogenase